MSVRMARGVLLNEECSFNIKALRVILPCAEGQLLLSQAEDEQDEPCLFISGDHWVKWQKLEEFRSWR